MVRFSSATLLVLKRLTDMTSFWKEIRGFYCLSNRLLSQNIYSQRVEFASQGSQIVILSQGSYVPNGRAREVASDCVVNYLIETTLIINVIGFELVAAWVGTTY